MIFTAQEEMRSPSASAGEGWGGAGELGPGQWIQRPPAPLPTPTLTTHWPAGSLRSRLMGWPSGWGSG